ncbi:MAG: hypothetical protein ABH829_05930 [archaeon]
MAQETDYPEDESNIDYGDYAEEFDLEKKDDESPEDEETDPLKGKREAPGKDKPEPDSGSEAESESDSE